MHSMYGCIKRYIATEKSYNIQKNGMHTFEVALSATKPQIREALEKLFAVKVLCVRTQVMPGKVKKAGRGVSKSSSWKKAIVRLPENQRFEPYEHGGVAHGNEVV